MTGPDFAMELDDEQLQQVYCCGQCAAEPPEEEHSRDFADGVLIAEIVHSYFPRLVELHNYSAANLCLSEGIQLEDSTIRSSERSDSE